MDLNTECPRCSGSGYVPAEGRSWQPCECTAPPRALTALRLLVMLRNEAGDAADYETAERAIDSLTRHSDLVKMRDDAMTEMAADLDLYLDAVKESGRPDKADLRKAVSQRHKLNL